MTDNTLTVVNTPRWTVTGTAGCCGIGSIHRLAGRYCAASQRDAAVKAWYESEDPKALMSDMPGWSTRSTMAQIFAMSAKRPQGVRYKGTQATATWYGAAVPVELCFAAVLEEMLDKKYVIYFMSDNMTQHGDVHTGPFSTKAFVRWLRDNEVGQFQATGPLESMRTTRLIQGWMFTPNWDQVSKLAEAGKKDLIKYFKELNNDKRVKDPEQDRLRERAEQSRVLADQFVAGW
jgi:hypothetical protein